DHALTAEHARVGDRAGDVLAHHALIDVDRAGVRLDRLVGGTVEASAPELLRLCFHVRRISDGDALAGPRRWARKAGRRHATSPAAAATPRRAPARRGWRAGRSRRRRPARPTMR